MHKKRQHRTGHDDRGNGEKNTHIRIPHLPKLLLELDVPDTQRARPGPPPHDPPPLGRDVLPRPALALHAEHHLVRLGGFGQRARHGEVVRAVLGRGRTLARAGGAGDGLFGLLATAAAGAGFGGRVGGFAGFAGFAVRG